MTSPSDDLEIRSDARATGTVLVDSCHKSWASTAFPSIPFLKADLEKPQEAYGAVWVATDNGEVIGSVATRLLADTRVAELKRMYLKPPYRGRGLGRLLLSEVVQWAESHGCQSLVLDTTSSMTAAQRLYEAAGFTRTGTRRRQAPTTLAVRSSTPLTCRRHTRSREKKAPRTPNQTHSDRHNGPAPKS